MLHERVTSYTYKIPEMLLYEQTRIQHGYEASILLNFNSEQED